MNMRERAYEKAMMLQTEIAELQQYISNIETEYEVLTDQYMNGDILWGIGKEQKALMKLRDKHKRTIERNLKEISRLRAKYGF